MRSTICTCAILYVGKRACPLTVCSNTYYLLKFSSLFLNLSTRPPASTNFCLPVKKGWHLEQTSTLISEPLVDFVTTVSPHAHLITHSSYLGWIASFIFIIPHKIISLLVGSDFTSRVIISLFCGVVNSFFKKILL